MTIACTEWNRRKREYYDPDCMFLDPNIDDVDGRVQHLGPLVFSRPSDTNREITVRILEIDKLDSRKVLIARKLELLEHMKNLVERIVREKNQLLRQFLIEELLDRCSISASHAPILFCCRS